MPPLQDPSPTSIVPILNSFVERAKWSSSILSLSEQLFDLIESNIIEISTIKQGVSISLTHLRHHSNGILKSLENTAAFATTLNENAEAGSNWGKAVDVASKIPVHRALLAGHDNNTLLSDWINKKEIESNAQTFETQRLQISDNLTQLNEKADSMIAKINALENDAKVWFDVQTAPITSDEDLDQVTMGHDININWKAYKDLSEDIATLVQKIQSDCNYVATLSDTPKNVNNALRITQLHERDFLAKAMALTKELWEIHSMWAESKTYNILKSISFLRTVSSIQFFSSPLRNQVNELGNTLKLAESKRITIARAIDMPYLYGALLFELIRRDEWMSRMKARVGQTAELLATWRDDEIRRRTKWIRQLGGSLGMLKRIGGGGGSGVAPSNSQTNSSSTGSSSSGNSYSPALAPSENNNVPDVEITIVNNKDTPIFNLVRKDMEDYLNLLKELSLDEELHELEQLVKKTDKMEFFPKPSPTEVERQQQAILKRKSLFKEGNISEYSKSLILGKAVSGAEKDALADSTNTKTSTKSGGEGNDEVMQSKIQVYEARIRKLEDLLHRTQFRESWTNRIINSNSVASSAAASATNLTTGFPAPTSTNNSLSNTPATTASPSVTAADISKTECFSKEERETLLEKISKLEADLASRDADLESSREAQSKLSKELDSHKNDLAEAQMMKSDLIANLSTKESEFNSERRVLREEIDSLTLKIEELEIELEREAESAVLADEEITHLQSWKAKAQETIDLQQKERKKFIFYKTKSREHYKTLLKLERRSKRIEERKVLKLQMKYDVLYARAKDLSQRLFTSTIRSSDLLECLGLQVQKVFDDQDGELLSFNIQRVKGLGRRARSALAAVTAANEVQSEGTSSPDADERPNRISRAPSTSENDGAGQSASMILGPLASAPGSAMIGPQQDLMKTIKIDPSVFYWMDPRGSSGEGSDGDDLADESDFSDYDFEDYEEDDKSLDTEVNAPEKPSSKEATNGLEKSQTSLESGSMLMLPKTRGKDIDQTTIIGISDHEKTSDKKSDDTHNIASASSSASAVSAGSKLSTTSSLSYEQRKQRKREQMINSGIIKPRAVSIKFPLYEDNDPLSSATITKESKEVRDKEIAEKKSRRDQKKVVVTQNLLSRYRRRASTRIETRYHSFLNCVYMDYDLFRDSVCKRFLDVEHLARKLQKESRGYRERAHVQDLTSRAKIAFRNFAVGDLALFLPTRDQIREPNPWAAFNIGAPHYFLKGKKDFRLKEREWLVARITRIEERVVDRNSSSSKGKNKSGEEEENDNPFDLSDGLRWHFLEAVEERFT